MSHSAGAVEIVRAPARELVILTEEDAFIDARGCTQSLKHLVVAEVLDWQDLVDAALDAIGMAWAETLEAASVELADVVCTVDGEDLEPEQARALALASLAQW